MVSESLPIKYVDWGTANRFSDCIEVNKVYKDYPELHGALLKHERAHTDNPGFTKEDLALDIKPWKKHKALWWKVLLTHPRTWTFILPALIRKGKVYIDINCLILWAFMLIPLWVWLLLKLA